MIKNPVHGCRNRVRHVYGGTIGIKTHFLCDRLALVIRFVSRTDQPSRHANDGHIGRHTLQHNRIGPDSYSVANLDWPQYFCTRANNDIVTKRRVALALVPAGTTERYTVIQGAIITNLRGLTDHHSHAVIDKEASTDNSARVDFDARIPPGKI